MAWQITDGPLAVPGADDLFCGGWALGCADFLEGLRREHEPSEENRAWEAGGAREIREARWMELLRECQGRLGPAATQPFLSPKGALWKVAIAAFLKRRTQVPNAWLAAQLHMGTPARVSYLVGEARKRPALVGPWLRLLETDIRP